MAEIIGTPGTDTLTGTPEADVLRPYSTEDRDILRGLDGADTYDLVRHASSNLYNFLIDDAGTDGAVNTITNVGALYYSASFGYQGYATAVRVGNDLILHTPGKPYRFRQPSKPAYDIEIKDQYDGGFVGSIQAGGTVYNLSLDGIGTAFEDLLAGSNLSDVLVAGEGNDWLFGNGGPDTLDAGAGNDTVFGGRGSDTITASGGNNLIFAEKGNDRITTGDGGDRIEGGAGKDWVFAGAGADRVDGGDGKDVLKGQNGDDTLTGGQGNDRLVGGNGVDLLDAGAGDNRMIGGKVGDIYTISTTYAGNDTIIDKGNAPSTIVYSSYRKDVVKLIGFASFDDAMHGLDIQISGDDLIVAYDNSAAKPGEVGQFTIQDHFAGVRFAMEQLGLNANSPVTNFHFAGVSGDNHTFSVHDGPDAGGNDIILGTGGADDLYGGIGSNIYVAGDGADVFIFKDQEDNRGGLDLILDFDLGEDVLDFTEIEALTRAGVSIADNAYGNAVLTSLYETIELKGISASQVTDDLLVFA